MNVSFLSSFHCLLLFQEKTERNIHKQVSIVNLPMKLVDDVEENVSLFRFHLPTRAPRASVQWMHRSEDYFHFRSIVNQMNEDHNNIVNPFDVSLAHIKSLLAARQTSDDLSDKDKQ